MILDEPTTGLDPQARHLVWQKLKELKSQGVTQLLCTQNMEEASILCDRVAIIHLGRILVVDTPQELVQQYVGSRIWEVELFPENRDKIIEALKKDSLEFEEVGNTVQVFHLDNDLPPGLTDAMARPRSASLEDVFFRLTGRSLLE
jgi:lipooligosaccharide transport system ATP-binding protein